MISGRGYPPAFRAAAIWSSVAAWACWRLGKALRKLRAERGGAQVGEDLHSGGESAQEGRAQLEDQHGAGLGEVGQIAGEHPELTGAVTIRPQGSIGVPIGAQEAGQAASIERVGLGAGQLEAVAVALHGLGIDRVDGVPTLQQFTHKESVGAFDSDEYAGVLGLVLGDLRKQRGEAAGVGFNPSFTEDLVVIEDRGPVGLCLGQVNADVEHPAHLLSVGARVGSGPRHSLLTLRRNAHHRIGGQGLTSIPGRQVSTWRSQPPGAIVPGPGSLYTLLHRGGAAPSASGLAPIGSTARSRGECPPPGAWSNAAGLVPGVRPGGTPPGPDPPYPGWVYDLFREGGAPSPRTLAPDPSLT